MINSIKIGQGGYAFVTDEGNILYHKDSSVIGKKNLKL
jgi:hypothetical protein